MPARGIDEIFHDALALPPEEREAFLRQACAGDEDLHTRISLLLAHHEEIGGFMQEPVIGQAARAQQTEVDPTVPQDSISVDGISVIGPYRLLERVGEGGMGEVWRAEQTKPVRRVVALKVIKRGMETKEVIARFEAERQALALMDHPCIAKVFDAGETPHGRPYIVMEYVRGVRITTYCNQHKLTTAQRLDLFARVCDGVQHAHQKAIIHRDLKPGNILVTEVDGEPVPKIIDFGVAKATAQRLTEKTMFTALGQMIGTPEYMSPEQARPTAEDIDTRTDVYSLGVILYELLVGALPFDAKELRRAGYEEILRVIREQEPQKPSTKISTLGDRSTQIAGQRGTHPRQLSSDLRGDLDWITMKALEKDRNRRYGSARELADDVQRHADNLPVAAGPPSAAYRISKFVRRHRAGVSVAVASLVVLLAFTVITTIQAKRMADLAERVAEERDRVVVEKERADAAGLYALSQLEEVPSQSLAYALASLENADQEPTRLEALKAVSNAPTFFRYLPHLAGAHNPWDVEFSPDGRWLAVSWSVGGNLRVYPTAGGDPIVLEGHDGLVMSVSFAPDSRRLVSSGLDGTIRAWAIPGGQQEEILELGGGQYLVASVLDDGSEVVAFQGMSGQPATLHRWSLGSNQHEVLAEWAALPGGVEWGFPDVHSKRGWVALTLGFETRVVRLADVNTSAPVFVVEHESRVASAVFSEKGDRLLTSDDSGLIRLWQIDPPLDRPLRSFTVDGSSFGMAFEPGESRACAGTPAGMYLLDLAAPPGSEPILMKTGWAFRACWHPTEPWVVSTGTGGQVAAWPTARGFPAVIRPDDPPNDLVFAPDGSWLGIACEGSIWVWPLDPEGREGPRRVFDAEGFQFQMLKTDRSGEYLFAGVTNSESGNGTIVMVPLDGRPAKTWQDLPSVHRLGVHLEGTYVSNARESVFGPPLLRIRNTESGEVIDIDAPRAGEIGTFGFTRDGNVVFFNGGAAFIADPTHGTYEVFREALTNGQLSHDGESFFWCDGDGNCWLDSLPTGEQAAVPSLPPWLGPFRLDPTSGLLAYTLGSEMAVVRPLDDSYRHRLVGHEGMVYDVEFDPLGRWVATCSEDETVRLWPMPKGASLNELPHDELLAKLRCLTSLRAIPDSNSVTQYAITSEEFPGWDKAPAW